MSRRPRCVVAAMLAGAFVLTGCGHAAARKAGGMSSPRSPGSSEPLITAAPTTPRTSTSTAPRGRPTPWWPLEAGADAQSVVVEEQASALGCPVGKGRVIVEETSTSIRLHINQRYHEGLCQEMAREYVLTAQLRAPIDGRRIEGAGLIWWPRGLYLFKTVGKRAVPLVPRLVGLAPDQAVQILATEEFRAKVIGTGREVAFQAPERGGATADNRGSGLGGTVTLTTGP